MIIEAALLVTRNGLWEALRLISHNLMVESDSLCVLRWALDSCRPPWRLVDAVEEILDLNRHLRVFFLSHQKRVSLADSRAKEDVSR